jgi:hypothetical protein
MDFLKFHPGLPCPTLLRPAGRATPEMALRLFLGWPARRARGLRLFFSLLDTPRRTPMGEEARQMMRSASGARPLSCHYVIKSPFRQSPNILIKTREVMDKAEMEYMKNIHCLHLVMEQNNSISQALKQQRNSHDAQ